MNPILLKASGETGSQVIIHGKVHSTMKAGEYYAFKKKAWDAVKASFDRLSKKHELIIMEGAGSPAEINLMDVDIVNMSIAKHAKAPVILVGDIDKGGVFASLYGTIKLLGKDSRRIKAYVINKFRGDLSILKPGLEMIHDKTGKPVIGVLPYINNIDLPEEDGMALCHSSQFTVHSSREIKIVVVRLQYISNFTDFDPFMYETDVEIIYSRNTAEIENADLVIIPGSKNTVKDLIFLKEVSLDESIKRAFSKGIQIMGMCGGYQMLGKKIYDPYGIESPHKEVDGLGLLNIETTFEKEKTTCQTEVELVRSSVSFGDSPGREFGAGNNGLLRGYEIHMGQSKGDIGLFKILRLTPHASRLTDAFDGSINGNCWGTYIHGIFENDSFRRRIINSIRGKRELPPIDSTIKYSEMKEKAIDNLADIVKQNLNMDLINRIIGL
jgi:adenosylcobyric acid synthase